MLKPAALGGLFIGVLSALPIVGVGNCCCCLWIVSGGVLAAYLAGQNRPTNLTPGEGVLVGGSAGLVGAFVWLPVALLLDIAMAPIQQALVGAILNNARDMPPEAREALQQWGQPSAGLRYVLGFIFQFFAGGIFGAIGGVVAAMFFRRDIPPALGGSYVPPIPVAPAPVTPPPPVPNPAVPPPPAVPPAPGEGPESADADPAAPDPLPPER